MSRKHYIIQARLLSEWREKFYPKSEEFNSLVDDFCRYFKQDNSRFDPARFREACGICESLDELIYCNLCGEGHKPADVGQVYGQLTCVKCAKGMGESLQLRGFHQ